MTDPVTQLLVDSRDAILAENHRLREMLRLCGVCYGGVATGRWPTEQAGSVPAPEAGRVLHASGSSQRDIPAPSPQGDEPRGVGSDNASTATVKVDSYTSGAHIGVYLNEAITAAVMAERGEVVDFLENESNRWSSIAGDSHTPQAWARAQAFHEAACDIRSRPTPGTEDAPTFQGVPLTPPRRYGKSAEDYPLARVPLKADSALLEKAAQAMASGRDWSKVCEMDRRGYREIARAAAKAFGIEVVE